MRTDLAGRRLRAAGAALAAALLAACATPSAPPSVPPPAPSAATGPLQLTLLAINDFHGNLKAPPDGFRRLDPATGRRGPVPAGGVAAMATLIDGVRAQTPNVAFVAAGDLVGATPLLSSLFFDEPTIEAMSLMGLTAAAMGNHELDRGPAEVLRLQNGGCHPTEGCKCPAPFTGARFPYLAANTVVQATGKTLFPAYTVQRYEGVPVAFIGVTLEGTPSVVTPAGVAGLRFANEAATVNALVPELKRQGIEAIVLLIHEGGFITGEYDGCEGISGPIVDIVKRLDKAVDVVVSGHTHRAYNCVIDGRPVTSADRYGTLVTRIDLSIDRGTRDVVKAQARNLVVETAVYAPNARLAEHVAAYERLAGPLAGRRVTTLGAPFSTRIDGNGQSELGRLIADAQLAAGRELGAQVALMNLGGVRAPLGGEGKLEISYEQIFAVQPFRNQLVALTITGAEFRALLEAGVTARSGNPRPLLASSNLSYRYDLRRPLGQRIVPGTLLLDGRPVDDAQAVRLVVNNFIADGGDDQSVLRQGRNRQYGPLDIDALDTYLRERSGLKPDGRALIVREDAPAPGG